MCNFFFLGMIQLVSPGCASFVTSSSFFEDSSDDRPHVFFFSDSAAFPYGYPPTHTIHGTGICTYIWLSFMVNVGMYTVPYMEHMGLLDGGFGSMFSFAWSIYLQDFFHELSDWCLHVGQPAAGLNFRCFPLLETHIHKHLEFDGWPGLTWTLLGPAYISRGELLVLGRVYQTYISAIKIDPAPRT